MGMYRRIVIHSRQANQHRFDGNPGSREGYGCVPPPLLALSLLLINPPTTQNKLGAVVREGLPHGLLDSWCVVAQDVEAELDLRAKKRGGGEGRAERDRERSDGQTLKGEDH